MNCLIIFINKASSLAVQNLIEEYEKRIRHYCNMQLLTITVPKSVRCKSIEEQKASEQKLLLKHIKETDFVVLLDEKGKEMNSMDFSVWIETHIGHYKRLVFVIGGPHGFSEYLKNKYFKLSLSKMTFSHELVRVIFLEQIYRAFTIIKGNKYHHD